MRSLKIITLLVIFFIGCSLGPKYIAQDYVPPIHAAVLPFTNETNDVDAPETVRKAFIELLPSRGYLLLEKNKLDQILLKDFGINEGGQLTSVSFQKLGETLNVDGLFYGNVITFVDFPFGFGRKRTVKANFKLIEAKTGKLLWEDEKSWTNPELHLSVEEARKAAIRQIAERQLEKITGIFLLKESRSVVELVLRNLPLAR